MMNKKIWIPKLNHYTKQLSMWQENLWRTIMRESYTFELAQGPQKDEFIQRAVSSFPYGTISAAGGGDGVALDTTITSMGNAIYYSDSIGTWRVYGYNNGVDWGSYTNFGSIGSATYTDGGSNSRTISAIYYHEVGGAPAEADDLMFCLNATSISNTDTTFVSIDYNGQNYTRASATYTATTGSCSTWRWSNINPNGPTSGTPALKVNI